MRLWVACGVIYVKSLPAKRDLTRTDVLQRPTWGG